jgi:hypothetical protein
MPRPLGEFLGRRGDQLVHAGAVDLISDLSGHLLVGGARPVAVSGQQLRDGGHGGTIASTPAGINHQPTPAVYRRNRAEGTGAVYQWANDPQTDPA